MGEKCQKKTDDDSIAGLSDGSWHLYTLRVCSLAETSVLLDNDEYVNRH